MYLRIVLAALAVCTPAWAGPINYVWNSGGGLKFGNNIEVSISGHFTYDTLSEVISDFETTLDADSLARCACEGSGNAASLTYQNGFTTIAFTYLIPEIGGPGTMEPITVSLNLNTATLDAPGPHYLGGRFGPGNVASNPFLALGGAFTLLDAQDPPFIRQEVAAVPEAGTWAMFLTGIVLAGFCSRPRGA